MDDSFQKATEEIPGLPPSEGWRRLWSAFFQAEFDDLNEPRLRPRWSRITAALAAILALTYLVGALSVFLVVRFGEGAEKVQLLDLVVPTRWAQYRASLGDSQVAKASKLAEAGQRREALVLVRAGVARSPANRDGRLLLARLLAEAGRPDASRQALLDGLAYHRDDPAFLHPLFTVLLRQQQDSRVLAIARELLPPRPTSSERDRLVALAAATANYFRGDYDQAEDSLNLIPALAASRDGRLLAAKIDWARGYRELALLSLRALAAERPHDAEVHAEFVERLRNLNLHDEARRSSLAFQIAHPALAGPRIELLRVLRETGEPARTAREVEAYFRDFGPDFDALVALADFAANSADPVLARRLLAHAQSKNFGWEPFALLYVEALTVARDFRGALDAVATLAHEHPDFTTRFQPVLNSLQALAHFGLNEPDPGRLFLSNYLSQSYLRAENLLAIANRLTALDATTAARDVLMRAIAADPLNQAALTRLVELDLNLNRIDELPAHLLRFVAMRQPSPDVLRVAQLKLGSDLFLFSDERPAALAAVRAALDQKAPARAHL